MSLWDDYWNSDYGLGGVARGLGFGREDPYGDAMKQYQKWGNKAAQAQNPFYNAGKGAIGGFQDWLGSQKDPSKFINNLMGQYQESPYAHNLQQQAMRAGENMGSATGLTGSTPLLQQMQQNAGNIASQDQNQWLQNVLGINTQYGQGLGNMMGMGQNAANALSGIYGNMGNNLAPLYFNRGEMNNQNSDRMMQLFLRMMGGGLGGGNFGGFT